MILPRAWRRAMALAALVMSGGFVCAWADDPARETEPPVRPDLTEMTPEQATSAMKAYHQATEEWERLDAPRREQAIKEEIAQMDKLKKERERREADPYWKPAEETPKVDVGPNYDWAPDAEAQGLDDTVRARLRRDGLAIAGPEFPQSFSIYGSETVVPFVTSDSLLNGFHVLLEASLKRFELRRSAQLRAALEANWEEIDRRLAEEKVPCAQVERYIRHLAQVLGPALRLLGSTVSLGDLALEAEVTATVRKITAAQAMELPAWMAPAEPTLLALDFRRCRPLGFYTDSPVLANYYRAVRWLQLVPLRAARENEVGAAALLAAVDQHLPRGLRSFVEDGEGVWGSESGATIRGLRLGRSEFLATIAKEGNAARAIAEEGERIVRLSARLRSPVNDRLRAPGKAGAEDAAVLVLAPTVLPDALFLEEISAKRPQTHAWPQGLEVAAWLGSDFAQRALAASSGAELAEAVKAKREKETTERPAWNASVPELYYDTLRALFETPDPAAPTFMASEAWQRKSVQTALAGWAQLRHAWELQTKLIEVAACAFRRPAGFVEPNGAFFQRMSRLEMALVAKLQAAGAFSDTPSEEIEFLRGELRKLERVGVGKVELDETELGGSELDQLLDLAWVAHQSDSSIELGKWNELHGDAQRSFWKRIFRVISERIEKLERSERVPPINSRSFRNDPDQQLFWRWQSLQTLTARLEAMVQKQLRGADWNEDEAALLKNYGEELGSIMGYMAAAAMCPKDDAPRWTTVYHDPVLNRNLAVGIGRPRALYVLYPWKGQPILCRGAVMTYYEYSSEKRLTDPEWKALLDSPAAPAQPAWIQPLISPLPPKR